MMNFSTNAHCSNPAGKENIPPSSKTDAPQVQRAKQRTVLGVLSENEHRGRSLSQGSQFSRHSSISNSSQLTFFGCASSSSYEVYVEEACEVVLAASGREVVSGSCYQEAETAAPQNDDLRFLLELSSRSCQDASMHSEADESMMSTELLCISEYAEDIHRHLRESEVRFRPRPGHLEKHPEITNGMRVILVDWLVEFMQEYRLCSETLHLAVNYLDRFLSCTAHVKRSKLQLVGTAALLIAAKYEEIFPPELNEFVYSTDSTYTKEQLIHMEHVFLRVLAFKMAAPTTNQFLHLFVSIHCVCATTENLALVYLKVGDLSHSQGPVLYYWGACSLHKPMGPNPHCLYIHPYSQTMADLSLLEIEPFLQHTPSIVAAGAYCLATYTVNKSLWPDSLHAFTGYTMADIVPCLADLHKLYISAETHPQQAIREKYKSSKYCRVSLITPPAVLPFL